MAMNVSHAIRALDRRIVAFTRRNGLRLLRLALGVVFVWFGALKIVGASPVASLVADMLPFVPATVAVRGLGILEVLVGAGLITGAAIRVTLGLFFIQMAGTFLILVARAPDAFEGNPLRLTLLGEFVVKNLVLGAAGMAIAGRVRSALPGEPIPQMLREGLRPSDEGVARRAG